MVHLLVQSRVDYSVVGQLPGGRPTGRSGHIAERCATRQELFATPARL